MHTEQLPGVDVSLLVSGQILPEYQTEDGEELTPTTTSFVEAVSGANFTVQTTLDGKFDHDGADVSVSIYLDGAFADSVLWNAKTGAVFSVPMLVSGVRKREHGVAKEYPFTFTDLETSDGAPKSTQQNGALQLGEITVKLVRCRMGETRAQNDSHRPHKPLLDSVVPEKALKGRAMSTRTKLGEAKTVSRFNTVSTSYPWGRDPFAIFTFKYRSHRDLQIEGMIERSPSPVPLEDRNPEDLSPEEARELVRRLRNAAKVKQEFKREKRQRSTTIIEDVNDDRDGEVVVTNNKRIKHTRVDGNSKIEVVDLT